MRNNESGFRKSLVWKLSDFEAKKDVGKLPMKVKVKLRESIAEYNGVRYDCRGCSAFGFYGLF